jgi:hypothetical protein
MSDIVPMLTIMPIRTGCVFRKNALTCHAPRWYHNSPANDPVNNDTKAARFVTIGQNNAATTGAKVAEFLVTQSSTFYQVACSERRRAKPIIKPIQAM